MKGHYNWMNTKPIFMNAAINEYFFGVFYFISYSLS